MNRFQVIPAAYLLLTRGHGDEVEVLLQLRGPATGYLPWHWASGAAGHVEQGESVFTAAAREAEEELGIGVDVADIEPLCAVQRTVPRCDDPVEQRADYFLTTRRWTGEPVAREPEKCVELRWCRLTDPAGLPEPMVPHERIVLELLAEGRVPPILSVGY